MNKEKYKDKYSIKEIRQVVDLPILLLLKKEYGEEILKNRKFLFNFPISHITRKHFHISNEESIDISISYASSERLFKIIFFVFRGRSYFKVYSARNIILLSNNLSRHAIAENKLRIFIALKDSAEYEECLDFIRWV